MDTQEDTNLTQTVEAEPLASDSQPTQAQGTQEESHPLDLSQTLGEEGQGVALAAEEAAQELPQAIDTAADAATQLTDPGVHPAQVSFLSQNKVYIAAGIVGVVVVTIAAGVMLSMGSSSRLQGMLDKRLMEQSAETNSLPAGLNKTETFAEEAVVIEAVTTEVEAVTAKGPTISPIK